MKTERESTRFKPVSVFMLFGTQGDVYPIAVVCPFMLDQFYWAERMFWVGVAQEPLKRNYLLPNENDDNCVREAGNMLARAINHALFPKVKTHVSEIAERLSLEDGVLEALKILKEEISCSNSTRH